MSLTAIMKGFASRSLPQPVPDAQDQEMRLSRYGDVYTIPALADYYSLTSEGSYFVGANPTIGTGIAFGAAASTSFNDTTGAGLVIMNTDQSPSGTIGKRLGIDYIKLICTTAIGGTITTPFYQMAAKIDSSLRYSSGGTQILPVSGNMDTSNATISRAYFGALTLTSPTAAARLVFRQAVRGAAAMPGVNDIIVINFGSVEKMVGAQNLAQAIPSQFLFNAPPVELGPGQSFSLHAWATAQTSAPVYEFEIGWFER
jgi:hypothetical protein